MNDRHETAPKAPISKPYDKGRLSYAGTFTNPWKSNAIRLIEWLTAKITLLRLIRKFERRGAPFGQPFWPQALGIMGIDILTLVDGMVLAELIGRVRTDYKILTRSLLTGIPEIAEFLIPVPFPHEENAREAGLEMRNACMSHLRNGGVIILFPAGRVAHSETFFGPAIEGEWNPFTAKMLTRSQAAVLPIRFPGHNTRLYQIANKLSATLRQGLLLHEIKAALNKPQSPIIGEAMSADDIRESLQNPRGFLAGLREHTLGLGDHRVGTGISPR